MTWLKNRVKDGKVIVWAHNGHLARSDLYGYPPLGAHLDRQYGSRYAVIATDFNHGEAYVNIFVARNKPLLGFRPRYFPPAPEKAYEFYFAQCRHQHFILETATKDEVLAKFLRTPKDMRMIGAWNIPAYKKLSIADNFDFIVYLGKTRSQW
ncbi:hypothetical protein C7T94_11065 [Pedobacter yulinensis]|uniref:Erythromycin esterase n=1 Tax=Pedobacter yulinensis TaxID=2126353 RepID=A0A2T3HL38_9SPHI|nr:erythromycin esterase family protein [Pedobacter yulinensis]PST83136.1 hypothetical protein C7T94_11065 [Pedobacter yulinensis]